MTRLDVWFCDGNEAWQRPHLLRGIFVELCRRSPNIRFRAVDPRSEVQSPEALASHGSPASPHLLRVVHPDTGAYSVVSFWDDNLDPLRRWRGWEPTLMRQLIATSGITAAGYGHYREHLAERRPLSAFHVPFTYDIFRAGDLALIEEQRRRTPPAAHRKRGLHFRGFLYRVRNELLDRLPGELLQPFSTHQDGALEPQDYFAELAAHRLAFSLNGAGEICNRDMEILGLGLPLFRPELRCAFHDPLIPGVHYVGACRPPDIPQNGTFRYSDPQSAAAEIAANCARWQEQPEALDWIARNGRAWFERNVLPDRIAAIACDLLDLSLLIADPMPHTPDDTSQAPQVLRWPLQTAR